MRTDRYKEELKKKKRKGGRTLKVLLLLILLLIIAIPSAIYYSYKSAKDSLMINFKTETFTAEIGDSRESMDLISEYEGIVTPSADFLDTDSVGEKKLVFTVSKPLYGGLLAPEKKVGYYYNVEDTIKPVMLWSGDGAVVEKGTEFDIKQVVGYGDNADPRPNVEYEGKVDMNTEGTYPLHVTVTDVSGNSIDWDTNITVAESIPTYDDDGSRFEFSDFKNTYAGDGRKFGIDVSVWQKDIDFEKVKAAGCDFVIIRIGWSEDGKVTEDDNFQKNYDGAKAAGLPIGLYMYSYDNSEEDVTKAASWIAEKLNGEKLDYPVAFDWEDFGQFQNYEMSFITLNRMYDAFADELKNSGYDCILYSSMNFLEKVWEKTDTRPVWLAHYTDKTDYKGPYRIWQQSSTGKIDGIAGAVDMNVMYE